jgi:hypothetical protein
MTDYTTASGDTFTSVAKKFFGDEAAAKALAQFNKANDESQAPAQGTTLKIPARLYGVKTRAKDGTAATVTLSVFLAMQDTSVVFYSPATKRYCIVDTNKSGGLSAFADELAATKAMAQKILDGWQGQDFSAMITTMRDLSGEVETFFEGLAQNPKNAIDELVIVKKHPDWDAAARRFFVRPSKLSSAGAAAAEWKDAADEAVRGKLSALKDRADEHGLDTDVLSSLCNSAQKKDQWPWQWDFTDAKAAAENTARQFSSAVTARFVRFIAGCGLEEKLTELEKKLSLGKSGSLAFSLSTGTLSGKWCLPSETGVNLFDLFSVSQPSQGKKPTCFLRCQIDAKGYACAEGDLSHFVSLPGITLKGAQAGIGGGTSAQAAGTLTGAISWSVGETKPFAALATVDLMAQVSAKEQTAVSFSDKTLHCSLPVKNIPGFSGSGSITFDISTEEGMRLIEHVFACILHLYFSSSAVNLDGFASLVMARFKHVIDFIEEKTAAVTKATQTFLSWFGDGALIDGTASGAWYVPEKKGFDLVSVITDVPLLKPLVKPGAHAWVRIHIELSGYAFGKAGTNPGTGCLPSLPNIPSANLSAAGNGQLTAAIEWRKTADEEFRVLGSVQSIAGFSGLAGMNVGVPCAMEYKNGTLTGLLSLKAIPGLGISQDATVAFTASGDEAKEFVNHLFSSLNVSLDSFLQSTGLNGAADTASSVYGAAKSLDSDLDKDAKKTANKLFG